MEEQIYSRIEIKSLDLENGSTKTKIYIDGHEVRGVRSFRFQQKVGYKTPVLTLDLNALKTTVDGFAITKADGFGEMKIKFEHSDNYI